MTGTEKKLLVGFGLIGVLVLAISLSVAAGAFFVGRELLAVRFEPGDAGISIPAAVSSAIETNAPLRTDSRFVDEAVEGARELRAQLPLPAPRLDGSGDLVELYGEVTPGVVSIEVRQSISNPFGTGEAFAQSAGSGFIFDDNLIVTNSHVVGSGGDVEIVFYDGQRREGRVIAQDQFTDLAAIEVTDMPRTARVLPVLGDFDQLAVGQEVIAVGNPFGHENTMTYGIISALGRVIPSGLTDFSIPQAIQTDAPINPGNSGGPLLDMRGRVIGVNAQINTPNVSQNSPPGNSGVGFAVPASVVTRVVPMLAKGQAYPWSYLGVTGLSDMSLDVAEANGLTDTRGAYILEVLSGGPSSNLLQGSSNASMQATSPDGETGTMRIPLGQNVTPVGGDIVLQVDGRPVRTFDDLLTYVALDTSPGQTIELTVLRDGSEVVVPIELGQRPASGRAQQGEQR